MEGRKTENFVMKIYLETIQNIVGVNGLRSILNYGHLEKYSESFPLDNDELAIPVEELRALFCSLYELFGSKGVRGLQLRVGRESSRIVIEGHSAITKPLKVATHLVPETKKMRLILEKTVEQSNKLYTWNKDTPRVELREEDDYFLIIHRDRFESEEVTSNASVCNVFVGNLQYAIEWITGHPHDVEEIECRAMGNPADVFRISKARKKD